MDKITRSITLDKVATAKLISMLQGPGVKPIKSLKGISKKQKKLLEAYIVKCFSDSWKRMREKNPICGGADEHI
jgi:hypothetical protein